jgi:hypothetical protein
MGCQCPVDSLLLAVPLLSRFAPALDLLLSAKLLFVVAKSDNTDVRPRDVGSFYLVADKPVLLFAAINLLLRAVL